MIYICSSHRRYSHIYCRTLLLLYPGLVNDIFVTPVWLDRWFCRYASSSAIIFMVCIGIYPMLYPLKKKNHLFCRKSLKHCRELIPYYIYYGIPEKYKLSVSLLLHTILHCRTFILYSYTQKWCGYICDSAAHTQ